MEFVKDLEDRLLFAIPKKGRLAQPCLDLLRGSDIQFHKPNRLDITLAINLPIALVFVPASEIPRLVGRGRVDLGITGQDQILEEQLRRPPCEDRGVRTELKLPFGSCKLNVQVPKYGPLQTPEDLIGKTIYTSFPHLSRFYFEQLEKKKQLDNGEVNQEENQKRQELQTMIEWSGGSVESSIALGDADGIVDLVESGDTMRAHGLKAVATVLESTAVLIRANREVLQPDLLRIIISRIKGVITAQKFVLCTYNVPRSSIEAACAITPGKRAPTINALEQEDWVAISAMVERKSMANTMDKLEEVGAKDILIHALENARTTE